jgi:hypothetical protein
MASNIAQWKFVLARSSDLRPLGELMQARNRSLTLELNASGSASFNIPMDDELGWQIQPREYAVLCYRHGSTVAKLAWSGYVNTIEEDITGNRMTVNCTGWLDRFATRTTHRNLIIAIRDDADLIGFLIFDATLPGIDVSTPSTGPWPTFSSGVTSATHFDGAVMNWPANSSPNNPAWVEWGGVVPNEGPGGATAYVALTGAARRSANWQKHQVNVLQAIIDLTNTENGCDIYIDPLSRKFYVYRKRQVIRNGTVPGVPAVVFGHGWGPQNIAQMGRTIDGSTVVNWALVNGGPGTTPAVAADAASQSAYGVIEEVVSLTDQVGEAANITLATYANADILFRSTPRQIYSFTPFNWTRDSSIPEPLVDYNVGDLVKLGVVAKPRVNIRSDVRVYGMSFSIDDEGNEKIGTLKVSP